MCGIFGSIGKKPDVRAIRTLALCNAERGNEAIGFFGSDGKIWKRAQSPIDALTGNKLNKYFAGINDNWFVAGHTRHGTRGTNTRENAHPFRYGNIVGAHNGIVDAPYAYSVDSQFIFDSLYKAENDYQKALSEIDGYWGLVWYDGNGLYLQAHNNVLALCLVGDVYYFSSDKKHLVAALGNVDCHEFTEGQTVRFVQDAEGNPVVEKLPDLVHNGKKWEWDWRTQGGSRSGYTYSATSKGSSGTVSRTGKEKVYRETADGGWAEVDGKTEEQRQAEEIGAAMDDEYAAITGYKRIHEIPDYDEKWQDAWSEYANQMD